MVGTLHCGLDQSNDFVDWIESMPFSGKKRERWRVSCRARKRERWNEILISKSKNEKYVQVYYLYISESN